MMNADNNSPIRVLIADDSAFMRAALSRLVSSDSSLQVVGTAHNGADAVAKALSLNPDVITLDLDMPGVNGLEALQSIMAQCPRPVIMISSLTQQGADSTLNALASGAFDYIPKQLATNSLDIDHLRDQLIVKIKAAAELYRRCSSSAVPRKPVRPVSESVSSAVAPAAIAIGTSTGGPKALQDILPQLPSDLSVPVLVVQHMPPGFTEPFARRLNGLCSIRVCEAAHDDDLQAGVVYLAPSGFHMTVQRTDDTHARILLSDDPRGQLHHPSVDVLMLSLAEQFGPRAMGIVMTGMGSDGVIGMTAIHRRGGVTLGQDEASSAVYGMPRACALAGCLTQVISVAQIPQQILLATRYRKRA